MIGSAGSSWRLRSNGAKSDVCSACSQSHARSHGDYRTVNTVNGTGRNIFSCLAKVDGIDRRLALIIAGTGRCEAAGMLDQFRVGKYTGQGRVAIDI
ncbi:hypothetical protein J1614_003719 [Plenodomus biglobosus]|nr:hypothetical protein J1614_003719 [Plenodomus biglobosus]